MDPPQANEIRIKVSDIQRYLQRDSMDSLSLCSSRQNHVTRIIYNLFKLKDNCIKRNSTLSFAKCFILKWSLFTSVGLDLLCGLGFTHPSIRKLCADKTMMAFLILPDTKELAELNNCDCEFRERLIRPLHYFVFSCFASLPGRSWQLPFAIQTYITFWRTCMKMASQQSSATRRLGSSRALGPESLNISQVSFNWNTFGGLFLFVMMTWVSCCFR